MQDKQRILVIEDMSVMQALLAGALRNGGYWVDTASTAAEGRQALEAGEFDLVLLDIELPDGDGLSLLKELKQASSLPVILVSGRDRPEQRALGLEIGADDYVPKPVYPPELLARVKIVLGRGQAEPKSRVLRFYDWTIDLDSRRVLDGSGQPVRLTKAEFELLCHLAQRPGRLLSRENLAWLLGTDHPETDLRSIDTLVSRVRRKLGGEGRTGVIETCRGLGYRFIAPVAKA